MEHLVRLFRTIPVASICFSIVLRKILILALIELTDENLRVALS